MRVVKLPKVAYTIFNGQYGLPIGRRVSWISCREVFHSSANSGSPFYFCIKNNIDNFRKLIALCEDRLSVTKRTRIYPTDVARVVYVVPAKIWKGMGYQLLTILCRIALYYNNESLETALMSSDYIQLTYPAVQKFLDGYTKYKGKYRGWVMAFQNQENPKLVKTWSRWLKDLCSRNST